MSGFRYSTPYQTALDASGVTVPGAKLYFYQSGTATPLSTYSNAALSIPNTNPVIADAGGLFPSIFLLSVRDYKVILTDSNGNQLWEADPVSGGGITIAVATVTNIAALRALNVSSDTLGSVIYVRGYYGDNDGGEGNFLCTDSNPGADNGGTIIWSNNTGFYFLRDTQSNPISLKWFGAKGDGATDDSDAAQRWLNAIEQFSAGYIPAASAYYSIVTGLTHTGFVTIMGDGLGSKLHYTGSGIALRLIGPRFSRLQNFYITGTSAAEGGLYVSGAQEGYLDTSVFIDGFSGADAYARRFSSSWTGTIIGGGSRQSTNGIIFDNATIAGASEVNSWNVTQHDCSACTLGVDYQVGFVAFFVSIDFSGCVTGMQIGKGAGAGAGQFCREVTIQNCYFETTNGIFIGGDGGDGTAYVNIFSNHLDATADAIHIFAGHNITVGDQQFGLGTCTIEAGCLLISWNTLEPVTNNAGDNVSYIRTNDISVLSLNATLTLRFPVIGNGTVAQLGSASPGNRRAWVTDANATTFNSIAAGGGANSITVYADGTNWRIGG